MPRASALSTIALARGRVSTSGEWAEGCSTLNSMPSSAGGVSATKSRLDMAATRSDTPSLNGPQGRLDVLEVDPVLASRTLFRKAQSFEVEYVDRPPLRRGPPDVRL